MSASVLIDQAVATEHLDARVTLLAAALNHLLKDGTSDTAVSELLPRLLQFRYDRNGAVRKCVVKLIEQTARFRPAHLPATMEALRDLSMDSDEQVADAVVLSMSLIYPAAFELLCTSPASQRPPDELVRMWRTARRLHLLCRASARDAVRCGAVRCNAMRVPSSTQQRLAASVRWGGGATAHTALRCGCSSAWSTRSHFRRSSSGPQAGRAARALSPSFRCEPLSSLRRRRESRLLVAAVPRGPT
jgi:hypothetical protein